METCKKGTNEVDQKQQEEEATSRRGDSDRIRSLGRCPGVCGMSNQVPSGQGSTTSIPSRPGTVFSTPLTRRPKRGASCVKPGTMTPATLPHSSHPNAVSRLFPEHTHTLVVQLRLHNSRNSHANPQAHTFPELSMHNLPGPYNHRHRGSPMLQQR